MRQSLPWEGEGHTLLRGQVSYWGYHYTERGSPHCDQLGPP